MLVKRLRTLVILFLRLTNLQASPKNANPIRLHNRWKLT